MVSRHSSQKRLPVYQDKDCDLSLIQNAAVVIIGYGSQGHAHAQNLKDSGVQNVVVGLRAGSASALKAREAGLAVMEPEAAASSADIVMVLVPDEHQQDLYNRHLARNMKQGAALAFAHGLNVHYGLITPRADLDVFMVAPKGIGPAVRSEYQQGRGVPGLIAVAQNASGKARDLALSYAAALGCGRIGILETTFKDECETDLFGEQAVLCGGISALIKAGFDTLVEAGYPPEIAYFECLHETKLVVDLIYETGIAHMRTAISNTAEYGDYTRGPRIINETTRAEMKRILAEIQSGQFVQEFMGSNKEGLAKLYELRTAHAPHGSEEVGAELRSMMHLTRKHKISDPSQP